MRLHFGGCVWIAYASPSVLYSSPSFAVFICLVFISLEVVLVVSALTLAFLLPISSATLATSIAISFLFIFSPALPFVVTFSGSIVFLAPVSCSAPLVF